jgi:crotonobetainyl-CoA:carnitine CoA-transferase CaiB-like acyl-CoA transferase
VVHPRPQQAQPRNLKASGARKIVLDLLAGCDALVENFRPGQLEKLNLGPAVLRSARPDLIIAHISGYGQTGPYRDRAAFGVIGEAIGGLRYLTNHPPGTTELPPVRVGVSIGDSVAGLYSAFGIMAALWQRDKSDGDGKPRSIDVALTESVFSLMEGMLPEYGALRKIKQPTGGAIATAAPSNAYPTSDTGWVLIAANSEPLFAALATLMAQPALTTDPRFQGNRARVQNSAALDQLIADWTRSHTMSELEELLNRADIPNSRAYTAADVATDPQYLFRGMVRRVDDPALGRVLHTGIVPHIPESPGTVRWAGPEVGQHTDEILRELCGCNQSEIARLRAEGTIV